MQKRPAIAVVAALLASPVAAQGVIGGAEQGAGEGSAVGGPVGGAREGSAVGGAVGGVTGVVTGLLRAGQAPRFREHVVREGRSTYQVREDVRRGMILPKGRITFYEVPREFGVSPRFRYTIVNDHIVLVNPRTRQVVQVID